MVPWNFKQHFNEMRDIVNALHHGVVIGYVLCERDKNDGARGSWLAKSSCISHCARYPRFQRLLLLWQVEVQSEPKGSSPALKNRLTKVSSTTATFRVEAVSLAEIVRPRRMGWPMISR